MFHDFAIETEKETTQSASKHELLEYESFSLIAHDGAEVAAQNGRLSWLKHCGFLVRLGYILS
jgi:hypothetical protein